MPTGRSLDHQSTSSRARRKGHRGPARQSEAAIEGRQSDPERPQDDGEGVQPAPARYPAGRQAGEMMMH